MKSLPYFVRASALCYKTLTYLLIFFSGEARQTEIDKALVAGANAYLIPFSIRHYAIAESQALIKYSNDVIELITFSEKPVNP